VSRQVALVTGATAGIGAEFARQLAGSHDLVLVARDEARLARMRDELLALGAENVETLAADLTTDAGCAAVADRIGATDRPVEVLVNNAGLGMYRAFGTADLGAEERQLDLNVRAVMRLSHAAVRAMTDRDHGLIINVSSVSAFVPRASNATYSASKAWVTMFSEGLAVQLGGTGVRVCAICPGFTRTEFHERAGADMQHVPERMWLAAPDVVREGLAGAFAGKPLVIPTRQYRTLVVASRVVPRPVLRRIMARRRY
jgi:short-subunit dehydrogenase